MAILTNLATLLAQFGLKELGDFLERRRLENALRQASPAFQQFTQEVLSRTGELSPGGLLSGGGLFSSMAAVPAIPPEVLRIPQLSQVATQLLGGLITLPQTAVREQLGLLRNLGQTTFAQTLSPELVQKAISGEPLTTEEILSARQRRIAAEEAPRLAGRLKLQEAMQKRQEALARLRAGLQKELIKFREQVGGGATITPSKRLQIKNQARRMAEEAALSDDRVIAAVAERAGLSKDDILGGGMSFEQFRSLARGTPEFKKLVSDMQKKFEDELFGILTGKEVKEEKKPEPVISPEDIPEDLRQFFNFEE